MNALLPRTFVSLFDDSDLMFRDFFNHDTSFTSVFNTKPAYPVDIKQNKDNIEFDIAVVGLDKKDIVIKVKDDNVLEVSYNKENNEEDTDTKYITKNITKKSFSFAWKITNRFNLSKLEAKMDKGLLKITVPIAPESQPKIIEIKDC